MNYDEFLHSKRIEVKPVGFDVSESDINPMLFPFQRAIVRWALRRGRAALFEDCGLGKSFQQIEWGRIVHQDTGKPVLIAAPLAVAKQTVREGAKLGIEIKACRSQADVVPGLNVTNYEMLNHFTPEVFGGFVLDESSILKAFGGVMRKEITAFGSHIPFRLCATATPAPNDLIELTNHAEFLDIMIGREIVALFFTQDGNTTHHWRLKGHARKEFWRWMSTWTVAMRRPSDLGYSDEGFILPPLTIHEHIVKAESGLDSLIPLEALTLDERRKARRASLPERVAESAEMVNASTEPWIVWCDLNSESEALRKAIPGSVEVRGSDDHEHKEWAVEAFASGEIRTLISKPSICGFGMNWQHCCHSAFVGLSDSYEQFYQAVRRCWRFGQTKPVDAHIIIAETEGNVLKNIQRKEDQATEMFDELVTHMKDLSLDYSQANHEEMVYAEDVVRGQNYTMMLGDCIRRIDEIPDNSIGLSVFSPPFPGMYAYTNSAHDMGNVPDIETMIEHFRFLAPKLLRVVMPGRTACVHLVQITAMKSREGYIGLKDYRGSVIAMMEEEGWIYSGEVTIGKNPQIQATRNKDRGLLFKSLATDSSVMRMALADYLIYFRKPGANPEPIKAGVSEKYNSGGGWITEEEWIRWANPIWPNYSKETPWGIRETNVLNVAQARETDDERHLCPLQIDVIERAVKLWSNPGDTVFSPFAGIGSEGYVALQLNRKFVGIELKGSYFESAVINLNKVDNVTADSLFDLSAVGAA